MNGAAPQSAITLVPGWETPLEQNYLYTLAQGLPEGAIIVEIGGEFGMSASLFSKGAPTAKIYSIDIAFDSPTGEIHKANLAEAKLGENVKRIAADSQLPKTATAFKRMEKAGIDLLFVDGGHTYQNVLNDLALWTPLVKAGGYLVLHDTANPDNKLPHPLHYEVSKALETWLAEHKAEWTQLATVDSITSFRRAE